MFHNTSGLLGMPHSSSVRATAGRHRPQSRVPLKAYSKVRSDLTAHFGGLAAYSRAPAEGIWHDGSEVNKTILWYSK